MIRSIGAFFVACGFAITASASAPSTYYDSCEGRTGKSLLSALCGVISKHEEISYKGLWSLYYTSDVRADGTIWDMYSTAKFYPGSDQCGNYKVLGDCYNREHSFPKSWFDDASPMYSDAFHLYPTDGFVNSYRSNYPFGECANGTYPAASKAGKPLGRRGNSTFPGYSGMVFEPDDEYKGDFARSYFYMAACYNDRISSWSSPMLSGNSYPCFTSWAVNLLLKWHRQDPVSKKEIDRNEVVYGKQNNRNPFIDHPELAEYIWGDKQGQSWSQSSAAEPVLNTPADGYVVDMGVTAAGIDRAVVVKVKGSNMTKPLAVSTSGDGLWASASSLSAAAVNSEDGASLTVTLRPVSSGEFSGSITLSNSEVNRTVAVKASVVDGLPAGPAKYVTATSFVATWVNIDAANPNARYTLTVKCDDELLDEYPLTVLALDQEYLVEYLEPETSYVYTVSSGQLVSDPVSVTTGALVPSISFLYDGGDELEFVSLPDNPSEPAELMLDIENVFTDISISVGAPFELSLDKETWAQSVTVDPQEDRFYLRLGAAGIGTYAASLTAKAGDYETDGVAVSGRVADIPAFVETFEAQPGEDMGSYDGVKTYQGTACTWEFADAGIWGDYPGENHDGARSARLGKTAASSLTMMDDKHGGAGTVSFYARPWAGKETGTIEVEYSVDGGLDWMPAGSVSISEPAYTLYNVTVNREGDVRVRLRQTEGKRMNIDDITISDYRPASVGTVDYHTWDAFCRDGQLIIQAYGHGKSATVYGVDGIVYHDGPVAFGETALTLPVGLYVVAVDDYLRRVLVRP